MSDETTEDLAGQTGDRSIGSRIVSWLVAFVILAVVVVAFMHVFAPAIGADETPPPGHWQSSCIACHLVTANAGSDRP